MMAAKRLTARYAASTNMLAIQTVSLDASRSFHVGPARMAIKAGTKGRTKGSNPRPRNTTPAAAVTAEKSTISDKIQGRLLYSRPLGPH